MTFNKAIDPNFETIGRRKKLTGYIGQITDESGIVLHSYEYSNYSQAETALNAVVYDLLMDYAERGLVDDLPGIENEPSEPPVWPADNGRETFCANPDCGKPHYTWQCPQIRELLFAPFADVCISCGDQFECDASLETVCGACLEWAEPIAA